MTTASPPDPVQHIFQLATGYAVSTALQLAVEVGVADRLTAGPLTARELAEATSTNEDALYRVLRLLASVGVFDEIAPRRFALTPAADILRAERRTRSGRSCGSSPIRFTCACTRTPSTRSA